MSQWEARSEKRNPSTVGAMTGRMPLVDELMGLERRVQHDVTL
jgi:hypothetical protein